MAKNRTKPTIDPSMLSQCDPADWQERHSPTLLTDVTVWDSDEGTAKARRQRVRRRRADDWLGNLPGEEQAAALAIRTAFLIRTSGMGLRAGKLVLVASGPPPRSAGDEVLCKAYLRCCRAAKASHEIGSRGLAMAVAVLGMGESLRHVGVDYRVSHHTVRRYVGLVLQLYCDLRGWSSGGGQKNT